MCTVFNTGGACYFRSTRASRSRIVRKAASPTPRHSGPGGQRLPITSTFGPSGVLQAEDAFLARDGLHHKPPTRSRSWTIGRPRFTNGPSMGELHRRLVVGGLAVL